MFSVQACNGKPPHCFFFVLHFLLHLLLFTRFCWSCCVLCAAVCLSSSSSSPLVGVVAVDDLCLFWSFIKQELELLIVCCNIILVVGDGLYVCCLTVCHSLSCSL